ncbi:hypothetical protein LCGC14_1823330 [marine sediment metagenome]|uniref:Uncharacterized protein n=1 Tax=marine sediment metagenome TaxID=412755 RepID=A0A0F9IY08_9ZZZZ
MTLCRKVVIFTIRHPNPVQIEIDLPEPVPSEYITSYLYHLYCDLIPKSGWIHKIAIRNFEGNTVHLELFDRVWLLPTPEEK